MNKIFDSLKVIYLKRPILFVLLVSSFTILPFISMTDFYTKGEPREATVATDILTNGNWILPADYADEVAYKPPFMHWFIAVFSIPAGHVTETTARLPSALGLIGIVVLFFAFLHRRSSSSLALIASLILLTSFEMHRSGLEARVDMFLAFFMIGSLIQLFKWEEKGLKVYPVLIPLLLGGAGLVKGPVGIILPCLVFGVYLLFLRRYSLWQVILKNSVVALPAFAILTIWYYLAYLQGGEHFINLVYAENFGRFLGQDSNTLDISYDLGHRGPFWYYLPAVIVGFMPWSFLAIFSIFSIPFHRFWGLKKTNKFFMQLPKLDNVTLFSVVSVIVILGFYAIPSSKRSVYIMPAYPFAAYLLAKLFSWALEVKPLLIRLQAQIILFLSGIILLLTLFFYFVNLNELAVKLTVNAKTLYDIGLFSEAFLHANILALLFWLFLFAIFVFCLIFLIKKNAKGILYTSFLLFISLQLFLEGFAYPVFKNGHSMRPFAQKIESKYKLNNKVYVMNNLKEYPNMYELNFYLGNNFRNFEKEMPSKGFFLIGSSNFERIKTKFANRYNFQELDRTDNGFNDFRDVIILTQFTQTKQ